MKLIEKIKIKNARMKANILKDYLPEKGKVLDFGCGDLMLAQTIKNVNTKLQVTGIDVANFGYVPEGVSYVHYDGEKMPFKDISFDTVYAFHVFHHCDEPIKLFKECLRVAKRHVLFVEPTYRTKNELPMMKFMDWFYNTGKKEDIYLPYSFLSKDEWLNIFKKNKVKADKVVDIDNFPEFVPIGRSYLFSVLK